MSTRMQQRRGTASQWISTNSGNGPILAAGEIGFESDTNKFKIGDGVNHWVDLTYFTDAESALASISGLVDGAPALLDTLNELAAAIGDDASFVTTINNRINGVETSLSTHNEDTTNVHGISNTANLATKSYVDDAVTNSTVDQAALAGSGLAWNTLTSQFDVDESTIATKTYVGETADLAVETHSDDTTSVHGIADTADLATKHFAAQLLTTATLTNITITGDEDGLIITAENGVDDSTTDNLAEGTNHLYFTNERAQDAIGNSVGTGLTYTDATGEIKVDTTTIQARVSGVSDTEIGYLDGVTSKIQDQLDAKASSLNPVFTGTLTLPDNTIINAMMTDNSVDTAEIKDSAVTNAKLAGSIDWAKLSVSSSVSATELGYVDGVTSSIQTQLDAKAPLANPTFTGTVAGITKSMVGLGNVDNTSDANKPVSTATQSALDLKADLAHPTFTGTTQVNNLEIAGSLTFTGTATQIDQTNLTITDSLIYLANSQFDADLLDIGIYGAYGDTNAGHFHTGLIRDASDSKWKLISGGEEPTSNIVDFTSVTYDTLKLGALEATSATIGNVSNTELQYLDGVTSAIQTQLDSKAPLSAPTFTGTVVLPSTTSIGNVSATEIGYVDGVTSSIQTQLDAKAPLAGPTFTGTVVLPSTTSIGNVSATELGYVDGVTSAIQTQLDSKVSSLVTVNSQTSSYTVATSDKDKTVEMNVGSANTITVPLDLNVPNGTQIDILQVGSGQTTVVAASGVTINATPGLKLRTQWAGATLRKRDTNLWVLVGDLTA